MILITLELGVVYYIVGVPILPPPPPPQQKVLYETLPVASLLMPSMLVQMTFHSLSKLVGVDFCTYASVHAYSTEAGSCMHEAIVGLSGM